MNTSVTDDHRSPRRRLIALQMEHADLNALIDQLSLERVPADELRLRRLKKKRLALRDQMAALHWQIDPREPA